MSIRRALWKPPWGFTLLRCPICGSNKFGHADGMRRHMAEHERTQTQSVEKWLAAVAENSKRKNSGICLPGCVIVGHHNGECDIEIGVSA